MKNYSKILCTIALMLFAFYQCTPDDDSQNLYPEVVSGFSITVSSNGVVTFDNASSGSASYVWDFGDGNTSTEESPEHYYRESGTYTITLTATNVAGETTTYTQEIEVVVEGFTFENSDSAGGVQFTNTTQGGVSYEWDFGDGNSSTQNSPMHSYDMGGTYTVTLTVTYPDGNVVVYTHDVMPITCTAEDNDNSIDPGTAPLYIGFKDGNTPISGFGDMVSGVETNPSFDDVNPTCNVFKYEKTTSAQSWSGIAVDGGLTSSIAPATQGGVISLKAYGATRTGNVTVRLEFEPFPNVDPAVQITQAITAVGEWQDLNFDFSAHTDKTFKSMVIYVDQGENFDGAVFYIDEITQVDGLTACSNETMDNTIDPDTAPIYIGFKDATSPINGFGDLVSGVVDNPDFDNVNPTCNVFKYEKNTNAQSWSGIAVDGGLTSSIAPATQPGKIKLKAYGATRTGNVTVRLEFEPYPNVDPAVEIVQPITAVGVWQDLTFDFSAHTDKTFKSMVIYVDKETGFDGAIFYLDEITQTN